mgnify:CR=1 FL=1
MRVKMRSIGPIRALEAGTPLYASYRIRPLRPSEEILARFDGERRQFLTALFRQLPDLRLAIGVGDGASGRAGRHHQLIVEPQEQEVERDGNKIYPVSRMSHINLEL